jgi:bacteriocin-like protein
MRNEVKTFMAKNNFILQLVKPSNFTITEGLFTQLDELSDEDLQCITGGFGDPCGETTVTVTQTGKTITKITSNRCYTKVETITVHDAPATLQSDALQKA